jgi:flavin reductase (DIM6/NTAB) family NADH-FMN oxidoreductase RutF
MADDAFGDLVASADPPLIVVTTAAEGEQAGCLVGFHAQSSIDPERYSVWLSKANHTYRVALRSAYFAVHFLTVDDLAVAEHFGTVSEEDVDKFADIDVEIDQHGVPLLVGCPHRMVLERTAILDDGGDHVCLTTRVLAAESSGRFQPLRVSDAGHLDAGRDAEERAIDP